MNPNPVGSKESLDYAPGPAEYHAVHKKYHAYFRELVQEGKGYADLLFVDPQGNCVYSVCKELDFGTNFLTGPYNSTGVAKAFLRAVQDPDGVIETAFEPYAPSNDALASFTAAGVRASDGSVIGFVVLQISSPLLVSIDENGDAIDSYAILNVVSIGKLLKMVQVAVVLYERPDFKYSTAQQRSHCAFFDRPCDNSKIAVMQVPAITDANRLARCPRRSAYTG
jgi:methyl-accepting chemotaxis protein